MIEQTISHHKIRDNEVCHKTFRMKTKQKL